MAQRINITLPDLLFDRLQKVKTKLNVSGVAQDALEYAVRRIERTGKELSAMDEIIERLKTEKKKYEEEQRASGYENGLKDAKDLDYESLLFIVNTCEEFDNEMRMSLMDFFMQTEAWTEWLQECIFDDVEDKNEDYFLGWIDGVQKFWGEVESKLV